MHKMFWGIDATRFGWVITGIRGETDVIFFHQKLHDLFHEILPTSRILIDMPIGLADKKVARFAQRPCDAEARKLLGKKHSSIFNPPCIEALSEKSYTDASRVNYEVLGKKLSKQSWNIAPKIRELNTFLHLNPEWRGRILESHPELAFQFLNDNKPLLHSKKTQEGINERIHILEKHYPAVTKLFEPFSTDKKLRINASKDDIVDSLCLAVLNYTRSEKLRNISDEYPEDSLGNRMGIWL
jgi:predicted RNase H-like nuclease